MFFFDWTVVLLLPGLLLGLWAQNRVISTYRKYQDVPSSSGLTGRDMAARILQQGGVTDVKIEATPGRLSDHYDPMRRTLRLSEPVYASNSIAALGVAAHEAGHAIQPGPRRLASLDDLHRLAAAEGIAIPSEIKTAC
jgi:Zn-dependent membrane protease YugP